MAWPRASSTVADRAARWSRLRGVAHLKRQRWFGEDEEVEGLMVVRWSSRFGQWSCGLEEWLEHVAVSLLRSPPTRGGESREGGNGEREWWGLRCRLRVHARAHARDVEAMAGHERHAAPLLCAAATTAKLFVD
jgi:hypothetical protein